MTEKTSPDIYRPIPVPKDLKHYIRRAIVAETTEIVDMTVDVRATGYHYFGWVWRGRWRGLVNGETRFDSDIDGPFHLSGQVAKSEIIARMQRDIGQIFLEFTALGHFQLLGITGARMLEDAVAPQSLIPDLGPHLKKLQDAKCVSLSRRIELLAEVLSELPIHVVPDGISAVLERMEAADGVIRIAELLAELGLAERQFRNDFKALTGLTPKGFCKTLQINQALNQLLLSNGGDLAGVAAQTGFADQAHFTRAFRTFLGKAPVSYLGNIDATLARFVGQSRKRGAHGLG